MAGQEGKKEEKGETLKRGECDYKGGDAVTPSYSRVERKAGRGNSAWKDIRM